MKYKYIYLLIILLFIFGTITYYYNFSFIKIDKLKEVLTFPGRVFSKKIIIKSNQEMDSEKYLSMNNDIQELKDLLDLNTTISNYELISSTIIYRDSIMWYEEITIDKGLYYGIEKGMCVINSNGFIGEVTNVTNNTSDITLITSPNFKNKISIKINNEYGITTKYDLKKEVLIIDGIDNIDNININDNVITSGLSSIYPSGIIIGKVSGKRKDKYGIEKYIEVKLNSSIKNTHYVSVLKR